MLKALFSLRNSIRPIFAQWGLTGPQWRVFRILGEAGDEGLMPGQISERLSFTHGNATGIVDKLEEAGLAERAPHPDDRRAILVRLTARGQELNREVGPAFDKRVTEMLSCLSSAEKSQLAAYLNRLLEHAQETMRVAEGDSASSSAAQGAAPACGGGPHHQVGGSGGGS